jgi:mono/diheme cytochrome c family protein
VAGRISHATIAAFMAVVAATPAGAEDPLSGREEFRASCASCHGVGAKGDGPVAETLSIKPADLTILSKTGDGEFPLRRVFETIDGRNSVKGHGDRVMPIWGTRYKAESNHLLVDPDAAEWEAVVRILALVLYLQNIQEP